jgi:general stress protein 26
MIENAPGAITPASSARVNLLLNAARDTVAKVADCWAATSSETGGVNVRVVGPIAGVPGEEDWTIWFTTWRASRKAADIRRSGLITLGYQYHPERAYVALIGGAALIEDRREIRERWRESWRLYFAGGPDDPNTIFVRMNTHRIELCVPGVSPEPFGSRPSVIERGDDRSWRIVSD